LIRLKEDTEDIKVIRENLDWANLDWLGKVFSGPCMWRLEKEMIAHEVLCYLCLHKQKECKFYLTNEFPFNIF
jgi:hypothetical protein